MRNIIHHTVISKIRKNVLGFFLLVILLFFYSLKLFSQPSFHFYTRQEYIELYKEEAIKQMIVHGVPASITLAQGMLESNDGNSPLAKFANNHFGIKCHSEWDGKTFIYDDDKKGECFRKYDHVFESYEDHSLFLKSRRWYDPLFKLPRNDYKGWAYGLKKAGYATEPRYAEMLIEIIEKNQLYKYDNDNALPGIKPVAMPYLTNNLSYSPQKKIIEINNGIKCVRINDDDCFDWLAHELKINKNKLLRFNDYEKDQPLKPGDIIYLEPKKHYNNLEFYTAKNGDTMHSISQQFGIKLERLLFLNQFEKGREPVPGQKIFLAYKKP